MRTVMKNPTILVTGAATGLGKEMALFLAQRGFHVYATMRDVKHSEGLATAALDRKVQLRILPLDVMDMDSIQQAVRTIVAETGAIGAVINNAGIGLRGYFEDLEEEEIRQVFDANVLSVMRVTRAVLPHMREAGAGRILFISSIGGRIGSLGVSAYCATKFAVEGFAESLLLEVAPLGLHVVLIEPGIINTERWSVNRGLARGASNPNSPYYVWFCQAEKESDQLVRTSGTTAADVAEVIHEALTVKRPKLRYMVGRKAKLAVALRRWLPGETFERIYFGIVMRRVAGVSRPASR
jgi:NAD(P)-dependent dehydrogenase (short-subunit alcohol dehydrogenase family)